MFLDEKCLEEMVYGGAVLGCGGGGSIANGLATGRDALATGRPYLINPAELADDAILVTLSGVGPVGLGSVDHLVGHHARALELFMRGSDLEVGGFIASEVGAGAVAYGWHESAVTGKPVVDAPCNGRAHPMALMGSLGLHRLPGYLTTVAAVGGDQEAGTDIEMIIRGSVQQAAQVVRYVTAAAGSSMAVVRNPAPVAYVREHAAVGALQQARRVGEALLAQIDQGLSIVVEALSSTLGGGVPGVGFVRSVDLCQRGGFTVGTIIVDLDSGGSVEIPVCNEYMMVVLDGSPVSVFPDLIAMIDEVTCLPLGSTASQAGQRVAIYWAPRDRLTLGSTMKDRSLLQPVESLLDISLAS